MDLIDLAGACVFAFVLFVIANDLLDGTSSATPAVRDDEKKKKEELGAGKWRDGKWNRPGSPEPAAATRKKRPAESEKDRRE